TRSSAGRCWPRCTGGGNASASGAATWACSARTAWCPSTPPPCAALRIWAGRSSAPPTAATRSGAGSGAAVGGAEDRPAQMRNAAHGGGVEGHHAVLAEQAHVAAPDADAFPPPVHRGQQ